MKKERVEYDIVDDFDQTSPAQTTTFRTPALEAREYEIDLAEHNLGDLKITLAGLDEAIEELKAYVEVARPINGKAPTKKRRSATKKTASKAKKPAKAKGPSAAEVRRWAREQGITVAPTGAVPREVRLAYEQEHDQAPAAS